MSVLRTKCIISDKNFHQDTISAFRDTIPVFGKQQKQFFGRRIDLKISIFFSLPARFSPYLLMAIDNRLAYEALAFDFIIESILRLNFSNKSSIQLGVSN